MREVFFGKWIFAFIQFPCLPHFFPHFFPLPSSFFFASSFFSLVLTNLLCLALVNRIMEFSLVAIKADLCGRDLPATKKKIHW